MRSLGCLQRGVAWPLVSIGWLVGLAGCAETAADRVVDPSLTRTEADQELRAMVPAEANLLLSVDLAALRKSPWTHAAFQEALAKPTGKTAPENAFANEVDRLVFAMVPAVGEGASLLIAQGRFTPTAVLGMFKTQEGPETRSQYRGMELRERGPQALVIEENRLVLAGPTVVVRAALDCAQGQARSLDGVGWLESLQTGLAVPKKKHEGREVASLFVRLPDATRKQLLEEIGEGETLQDVGIRLDLGGDLVLRALGRTQTPQQAADLAARLAHYLQESQARPIVSAFGLAPVLSTVRFEVKANAMTATLRVSSTEREFIASRMAVVSRTIAAIRAEKKSQEKQHP